MDIRQPESSRVHSIVAFVSHDFLLYRLHDVRKELLRLFNKAVVPHFRSDEIDEVGREEDLLFGWRRCVVRTRNFEVADEAHGYLVVEAILVGEQVFKLSFNTYAKTSRA